MSNFTIVIDIFFILILTFLFMIKMFEKEQKKKSDWFFILLALAMAITLLLDEYILCLQDEVFGIIIGLKYVVYAKFALMTISKLLFTAYLLSLCEKCENYFSHTHTHTDIYTYILLNLLFIVSTIVLLIRNDGSIFIVEGKEYIRNHNFYVLLLPLLISHILDFFIIVDVKQEKEIYYNLCCIIALFALTLQLILKDLAVYIIFTSINVVILYLKEIIDNVRKLADTELQLTNAQIELMLSQIQPHFLFNALSAIGQVCETDSKLAAKSIDDFAFYLRGNIESISNKKMIPFEEELKHINYYISLEKLRFQDYININYDIKVHDFQIPTLSLEPLVENAIRHGLNKKENGGTIKLSTYENDKCIYIEIKDDGVGFDLRKVDTTKHFGLINVKKRIETLANGEVKIISQINEGTIVKIILPKGNK